MMRPRQIAITPSSTSTLTSYPSWVKVGSGLGYTTFQTAATTKTNTLLTLPAAGIVHATKIKHSTAFSGGAIASVTISVGIAGTADKYASAFDVFQAVSGTTYQVTDGLGAESHTGTTAITVTATSTGANLSALTAGVVDIWCLLSIAN